MQKAASLYRALGKKISGQVRQSLLAEKIEINKIIRSLREERKLTGVELCKRAGDLDPKTLTAIEKGRIRNPSIKTLQSVARGLSVTVSDLFRQAEMNLERHFYMGSQKGAFQMDFPGLGVKAVSFTPFIKDFFCGKLIFAAKRRLDESFLGHPQPLYVSTLVGRFEVKIEDKKLMLQEGENLFFNAILKHSFYNVSHREAVLFLVTAPSFL